MSEPAVRASLRWCPVCSSSYRADFTRCPIDGEVIVEGDSDPLIGLTVGQHYVIDSFIGEGAMARVYRAHHALLEQKLFAIKILIGDYAASLAMRMRFAQEADAASQLEHPHVVSIVDFGRTDSGLMFIAMELVDGQSLANLIIAEAPLSPTRALSLARQICAGLGHAHKRGLVHRDLKPDNVIISGTPEQVKIVDFGLAIPIDNERSPRLTHDGLSVGTPLYAAPEQTRAEHVDHRADLFALGVTLHEMLTGQPPFAGGIAELFHMNASDSVAPIPGVSPAINTIVRTLMRREPSDRYAGTSDVIAAIDRAVVELLAPISLPASPAVIAPRRGRRQWWIVACAILATAVVVLALRGSDTTTTTPPPSAPQTASVSGPTPIPAAPVVEPPTPAPATGTLVAPVAADDRRPPPRRGPECIAPSRCGLATDHARDLRF